MTHSRISRQGLHVMQRALVRAAYQGAFNTAVLITQRNLQVKNALAVTLKSEVPRFDHAGMNGSDSDLVNLLQRIVESLLFFHPAAWLVSTWARREREACCDALVVSRTAHPHAYAELLVALAAQMPRSVLFHPAASSAMAAGPLRSRIRRILQLDEDPGGQFLPIRRGHFSY